MSTPVVSIVIRTFNEAAPLTRLLSALQQQEGVDLSRVEIIVVDNESTDGTREVAQRFGAHLLTITRQKFSYPRSMNMGVAAAHAPIVLLMVGHATPIDSHWLHSMFPYFDDPNVAGVYGPVLPSEDHGFFEGLMYTLSYVRAKATDPGFLHRPISGVFSATNIALRKSLWELHPFEEQYKRGGEDTQWAKWAFSRGYTIVREVGFTVRHSHGLSLKGLLLELTYWHQAIARPTRFSRNALRYRKDIQW